MWLIKVSFLQLPGRGRSCHPGHYILCFYDVKARHKASLLTATRKLENIFRRWAGLDAGCWWFISLLWSSWVLSSEHHLFFEISTRLLSDGLPLTLRTLFSIRSWQLCKPETTSRVCITVSNSPNPSSVYIRLFKHRKKVFYCLNIAFFRKILLLCRLQAIYL